MKLKHNPIIPDFKQPFLNCKLGREKYANILTQIVASYAEGFVLAINNEWGAGKTTFVRMWQQQLKNQHFETLYFNAWENDYDNSPLVALLAELKQLKIKDGAVLKKVIKTGAALTKSVIPLLIQALAEKYIDTKLLKDAIGEISKDTSDLFLKEVEEYSKRKGDMLSFKKELSKFITKQTPDKPLIFIIDELDRCKPDYAVQLLECVKHFFSIEGIVFILSVDKEQLQHAICGFYGNSAIDADNYLRRFIDIEYQLPIPNVKEHVNYLFQYFNLNEFFNFPERRKYHELSDDESRFKAFANFLIPNLRLSLRKQEKLFAVTRIILSQFQHNQYVMPDILFFLISLKLFNDKVYKEINEKNYSIQEFVDNIEPYFLKIDSNSYNIEYIYSNFIVAYKSYKDSIRSNVELLDKISMEEYKLTFSTKFNPSNIIEYIQGKRGRDRSDLVSLDHLLNKINLTSELVKPL